jgi:hypothetical protein
MMCGMGIGAVVLVVCGLFSVQPMCTERDFQSALGSSIEGDHEFIARAVFDDYTDQVREITTRETSPKNSQTQQLEKRKRESQQAKVLFDDLLESLAVLKGTPSWKMGLVHLRRSVLLKSRESNNPWPSTVWVDLPSLTLVPKSVLIEIDTFLLANADDDIEDRFGAMHAELISDSESCRSYEKRAMERWGNFEKIIAPFGTDASEAITYPQLATEQRVVSTVSWIVNNMQDSGIVDKARLQLALWKTRNTQFKRVAISLIHDARKNHGFDPWSRGCSAQAYASQSQLKNKLFKTSAQMKESTDEIHASLLGLLSPTQLQQFEEAQ